MAEGRADASRQTAGYASEDLFDCFRLGDAQVITLRDGERTFPLADDFIINAGRAEINEALSSAGMPPDQMTIVFNPVLIEKSGRRILIDTGNGPQPGQRMPKGPGLLMDSLAAAGIAPESIDCVVISHFHADHINGLLLADGSLAFQNAEITVPEPEWRFWMDDSEQSRAPPGRMQELFANVRRIFTPIDKRITTHGWDREVTPGLMAIGTPGHTPGHTSYMLTAEGDSLFIQSDVTNHPALFVRNPTWHARFDQDPILAEKTRRRVYEMLLAKRIMVQGFHFPFPGRGYLERLEGGFQVCLPTRPSGGAAQD